MSTAHLSAETVSDLVEGLLDESAAAQAEQHLAGCEQCRDLRAALADVRALLGGLPEVSMPAQVAERLDVRLTEVTNQGSGRTGEPDAAADPLAPPAESAVVSLDGARPGRRARPPVWLGAAAACAALVVGGYAVFGGLGESGQMSSGGQAIPEEQRTDRGSAESAPTAGTLADAGRAYDPAVLPAAVRDLVQRDSTGAPGAAAPRGQEQTEPDRPVSPPAQQPGAPAGLEGCLTGLDRSGRQPVATDRGTFAGKPVTVIVLEPRAAGTRTTRMLEVWVVGPSCAADDPDVRHHTRVSGP